MIQKINKIPKHSLKQTLAEVERLSKTYSNDMLKYIDLNIYQVFNLISKKIKFRKDPEGIELVMRPSLTMQRREGDCDDKTVMFLSWLILKKYPCGYSVVSDSNNKTYHHIFPFIYDKDNIKKIIDLDATYPYNKIGVSKFWAKRLNYYIK